MLVDIVTLEAPEEGETGAVVQVRWTGPDAAGDFIAVAEPGTPATGVTAYARTSAGSPAALTFPDQPGDYELRYVDAAGGKILTDIPIRVIGSAATLEAAPTVEAGSALDVKWSGPDNQGDYITIVPIDAEDGAYQKYTYTSKGSPAKLDAPDQPGNYEVRYFSALSRSVLARLQVTVTAAFAALESAPTIGAGAEIHTTWTGPDNKNDLIAIAEPGAKGNKWVSYSYTRKGSPLMLAVPDEPGSYELRYVTGQDRKALVRLPLTVN